MTDNKRSVQVISENMLDVFSEVKSIVNANRCDVSIDSAVFRLHWRFTAFLLISASAILTARQYVGEPIDCLIDTFAIPASMINTYCWVTSTFLVPSALDDPHAAYSGVDKSPQEMFEQLRNHRSRDQHNDRQYYPYYQWIGFVLLGQGACFYIPHYFWSRAERGLLRSLVQDLQITLGNDEERIIRRKNLVTYLIAHWGLFRGYALRYLFYETLSLVNLIIQIFLTDQFLDGHFISYGPSFLHQKFPSSLSDELTSVLLKSQNRSLIKKPMARIFPRMTKCTFYLFGSSGDVQSKDALCLLPLNIFHEKIYLFLWFWFFGLLLLSFLLLITRLILLPSPRVRHRLMKMSCKDVPPRYVDAVCGYSNIGDYFIFTGLLKNLDSVIFHDLISDVGSQLIKHRERPSSLSKNRHGHIRHQGHTYSQNNHFSSHTYSILDS